jgi:hypothetical protein
MKAPCIALTPTAIRFGASPAERRRSNIDDLISVTIVEFDRI